MQHVSNFEIQHNMDTGPLPQSLAIRLNPEQPRPWRAILDEACVFIKCNHGCVDPAGTLPGGSTGLQITTAKEATHSAVQKSLPLLQTSTTSSRSICHLLSIPPELFLCIFNHIVEPHQLQARVTGIVAEHEQILEASEQDALKNTGFSFDSGHVKQLVFFQPRTWSNMAIFQVCKAFRNLAVQNFGNPSFDSLPLNPAMDSVQLHQEVDLEYTSGYFSQPWLRISDITGLAQAWANQNLDGSEVQRRRNLWERSSWMRQLGSWYCNSDEANATPTRPPLQLSAHFLRKIQKVDILAYEGSMHNEFGWYSVMGLLQYQLPLLQYLKIDVWEHDDCGVSIDDYSILRSPSRDFYKSHDVYVLEGLRLYDKFHGEGGYHVQRLFPALKVFELCKVEAICSDLGERRNTNRYNGEWTISVPAGQPVLEV